MVPFQYFGVDDQTDLSHVDFRAGRYSVTALEQVYTADEHRAEQVLRALADRVRDPTAMRALGFCVSVKHAEFMAAFFNKKGLPALAVTGDTKGGETARRRSDGSRLASCARCSPSMCSTRASTFPRSTRCCSSGPPRARRSTCSSSGAGSGCTRARAASRCLDFIGRANRRFRFDRRFRAMLGGGTRAEVREAVEEGFPRLPSGCSIQLEEEAQRSVLENIKRTLSNWSSLAEDLVEDWPLGTFLDRADVDLRELYLNRKSFSLLREKRGLRRRRSGQRDHAGAAAACCTWTTWTG